MKKIKSSALILLCVFLLQSCASTQTSLNSNNHTPKWVELVKEGQKNLALRKFDVASRNFNDALKVNVQNSKLQVLNGIAYHLSAEESDSTKYSLAKEGYKLSTKFDPSSWIPYYLNGLISLKEKKFSNAKSNFLKATVRNFEDKDLLFNLIESSYYDLDFELASKVIFYLKSKKLTNVEHTKISKMCAIIFYAADLNKQHNKCIKDYLASKPTEAQKTLLSKKLKMWESIKKVDFKQDIIKVQSTDEVPQRTENDDLDDDLDDELDEDSITDERMVMVDVVIIGSTEDLRKKSGLNILNGLNLQFGNTADGVSAFSQARSRTVDRYDSTNDNAARTIIRAITIPAINYSLNIINSADSNSKILAKPSLIALSGQQSTFFSGVTINGAASSGNGDPVEIEKEIGVSLSVTPQFLSDRKVFLKVIAERTFLMDPSSSVKYDFRLDTTKTTVNSSVVINIGETLILGGLTEQQDANSLDGVPVLRDIPVASLLFSEKEERKYKKTVTILLTPRLSQKTTKSQMKSKVGFDKDYSDLLILNEIVNNSINIKFQKVINYSNYKKSVINNLVGSDDINLNENTKYNDVTKKIIWGIVYIFEN